MRLRGGWGLLSLLAAALLPLVALASSLLAGLAVRRQPRYRRRLFVLHAVFYGSLLPAALLAPYPSPLALPFVPAPRTPQVNLIANAEHAASWSGPKVRALGRVPAPAGTTNAEADCLELAPAPHAYVTPAVEVALPRGRYQLTGSLFVRSFSAASDGHIVHLQAGGFAAHEAATGQALGPAWQRLSHRNRVELQGDGVLLLLLVNHDPEHAVGVCVTAAQLEFGTAATPYQSPLARIEGQRRGGPDRAVATLAVLCVAALSYLSALGWGRLWAAARRAGLLQALAPITLLLGLWALEQRLGVLTPLTARATGLTHHPNVFAGGLAVFGLLALGSARRWPWAVMAIAGSALGLVATGSRGALVAFLVGLALWGSLQGRRAPRLALGFAALTLPLAFALSGRWEFGVAGQSRADIYSAALSLIAERPVTGWGLGSASDQLLRALWDSGPQTYAHAHNLVLQFGLEFGLIGLAGLGVALTLLVSALWSRGRRLLLPALASLIVGNLFDYTLGAPTLYVLALVMVGAALAEPPPALHEPSQSLPARSRTG